MNLSLILFLVGILGFVLNRKNIMLVLISIEMIVSVIISLVLIALFNFNNTLGQICAAYIISIAGAESAMVLGILVALSRLKESTAITIAVFSKSTFFTNILLKLSNMISYICNVIVIISKLCIYFNREIITVFANLCGYYILYSNSSHIIILAIALLLISSVSLYFLIFKCKYLSKEYPVLYYIAIISFSLMFICSAGILLYYFSS